MHPTSYITTVPGSGAEFILSFWKGALTFRNPVGVRRPWDVVTVLEDIVQMPEYWYL